jgi:hypothetical protein
MQIHIRFILAEESQKFHSVRIRPLDLGAVEQVSGLLYRL